MKKRIMAFAISFGILFSGIPASVTAFAEEEYYEEEYVEDDYEEEEEYIPETYYDPIQTNDINGWPQGQQIQAASGIVMDMDTGVIVYAKNIYDKHYPASITKIMTTLVALEHSSLDEVITCGEEVYDIEEDSSNLGIQPGEEVTMRQALYGLMLESANDLGNAIAVHIAGSNSAFAELMNEKAAQLGCTNTHFTNPHGLHNEEHYTCAIDMAKIAQAAYANENFRKIASTTEYTIPATNIVEEDRSFANHQKLLQSYSDYYRSWCTGGKTGFTTDAWNTLVTFAEQDGQRYVCVLLRENGAGKSYEETTALIDYAFTNFTKVDISDSSAGQTFYDILDLDYPNAGTTVYQSDLLKQKTVNIVRTGTVTVPVGTDIYQLDKVFSESGNGTFTYQFSGWKVGEGEISITPFPTGIELAYQKELDMDELLKNSKSKRQLRELQQTAKNAWEGLQEGSSDIFDKAAVYVNSNRMTVMLMGAFMLVILVVMIIILILRCTRESRMVRKRVQEDKARRKKEDEIDRKSAVEIEEELRQAMEEERLKREREERIREERRIAEEKLLEAERFLDEIRNEHND